MCVKVLWLGSGFNHQNAADRSFRQVGPRSVHGVLDSMVLANSRQTSVALLFDSLHD